MFHAPDPNEVFYTGEISSSYYFIEHDDVDLDEVVRVTEVRQAAAADGYSDFCQPVEDWMLD
jgi:hypothetical protein